MQLHPRCWGLALSRHVWSWNVTAISLNCWSESDQKAIREQLVRILNSGPFHQSRRRQRFLEYLVNETLAGRGERLKAYNVALEVFERPETFDPITDPLVRIEAARLRDKLREYYGTDGQSDPIHIDLPKGTYTPQIEFRHEDAPRIARREAPPTQEGSSSVPAVAVLSFDDLSADQKLGYLGDGVAEDIITALSRFPDLVVVARGSSFAYKGKAVDMRQVGKELGVDYVVEGSVRKDGDKLRIVSQLIDTKNGEHVWAERFDRSGVDPWTLQDEVTGMIVSAISPSSPLLKVKLGWHHMMRVMIFVSDDPPADIRKAGELARQALAKEHLSPQVARLANWLMSYVLVLDREFDGALAAADKTVAMARNDTFMLSRLMMVLVQVGRPDQALQWADQAAARDPALGWCYNYGRGWAYLVLGRFGEAVDALTQTEFNDAHLLLAIAYVRLGRMADARAEVVKMMKINPAITLQAWRLGHSFRDPAILDRCALDLAQAGLPEK